jgi:hypothetical protein
MIAISAVLIACAAAPVAGATPAPATASSGWRVVKTFGCDLGDVLSVTSTGAREAWAGGYSTPCSPDAPTRALLARWDGSSWQQPPLPPKFGLAYDGGAVAALSGSYLWTFPSYRSNTYAFLDRGGRWQTFRLAPTTDISSAVVFSRSNAWAFGVAFVGRGVPHPYAARFNGRTWRRVGIPVLPDAIAAPGPRNIWVVGPDVKFNWVLAHWTGRWQVVPLPDPPSGTPISGAWVDWDHPHSAWVVVTLTPAVSTGSVIGLLLHWTGSRWIDIRYPAKTCGFGPVAHDGHGGLWIASTLCRSSPGTDMVHYSPADGWSRPVPAGPVKIETMRHIPGTETVWAGGLERTHPNGFSAVILKYGP